MKILIENCKRILANDKYEEFEKKLSALKYYIAKNPAASPIKKRDRGVKLTMNPSFDVTSDNLIELRPEILDELAHILFIPGNLRQGTAQESQAAER